MVPACGGSALYSDAVIWLAIVFALTSAFFTALSTSVQHQAAGAAPDSVGGLWHLLWHLTQRPVWVLGQALGIAGFITHALAVINGPISLVQPIIITGIVFAVPIRAAISRKLPERREMGAVFLTAGALAIFLLASDPSEGDGHPGGLSFFLLVAGCAALGVLVFVLTRLVRADNLRAFLLGASAGLLLGLVAVLVKAAEEEYDDGGLSQLLTTWPIYALVVRRAGRSRDQPGRLPLRAALRLDADAQRRQLPGRAELRLPRLPGDPAAHPVGGQRRAGGPRACSASASGCWPTTRSSTRTS